MDPLTSITVACGVAVIVIAGIALRDRVALAPRTVAVAPPARRDRWRRRTAPADERQVGAWCELAAREVRAGTSLTVAIERAVAELPVAGAGLLPAVEAVRRGRSLDVALAALDVDPAEPLAVVVPVLHACTELGGPAAAPLDRVAATLHARADAAGERWAHSAQARLSARVLTILPVVALALLALGEPAVREVLVTPAGTLCVLTGAALNVSGAWWMRRVIARAT